MKSYKIAAAARMLDVSYSWLDKRIRDGKINVVWMGGVRRLTEDEILRLQREGVK